MGKRGWFLMTALGVALLASAAEKLLCRPAPEPVYHGKPLTHWLVELQFPYPPTDGDPREAIRTIGTNGIPVLLRLLRAHDSPFKDQLKLWASDFPPLEGRISFPPALNHQGLLGFRTLQSQGRSAVLQLIGIMREHVSDYSQECAAESLEWIGPGTEPAIPELLQILRTSTNDLLRETVFRTLGEIHGNAEEVVPALAQGLGDPLPMSRQTSAESLQKFGAQATSAIPALLAARIDPALEASDPNMFKSLQMTIGGALHSIDPRDYRETATNSPPGAAK
jgi:hypothetical protein